MVFIGVEEITIPFGVRKSLPISIMKLTGFYNRNCTDVYLPGYEVHGHIQDVLLSLAIIYVVLVNSIAITFTVYLRKELNCWLSWQLFSSYMGNIFSVSSLFGNLLYSSSNGIVPDGCLVGKDKFFFFYFGMSINVLVLVSCCYLRYQNIISLIGTGGKKVILDVCLPAWFMALLIAMIVAIIEKYLNVHQFLIVVGIVAIPLLMSIVWNLILNKFLSWKLETRGETLLASMQREHFILHAIIAVHTVAITIGSCVIFTRRYYVNNEVSFTLSEWFMRFVYFVLFTIEAQVFLIKTPRVRTALKELFQDYVCFFNSKSDKDIECVELDSHISLKNDETTIVEC